MDTLASEFAEIKAMLMNLQPPEAQPASDSAAAASPPSLDTQPPVLSPAMGRWQEDVLSTRASDDLNIVDEER